MRARILVTFAAIAIGLGATAPTVDAQGDGGAVDQAAFCEAVTDISLVFNDIQDEPTKKQQRKLARLADDVESSAPAELSEPVGTAVEAVRTGDFEDPDVFAAIQTVDEWVIENCGYAVHDVTGVEYTFEGMPATVDTGVNLFRFTDSGAELHEIVIMRLKGDETVDELLELPEKKAQKRVEILGGTGATPGETSILYTDLQEPGRYAAVCFLPVGSTSEEAIESTDGPPHAAEGMFAAFEVNQAS